MSDDKKKVVLLPCPHCGGRAALSTYKKRIGTVCKHLVIRQHAVCKVCGAQTRVFKALDRAPRAWNKRQTIQSDALREALEAAPLIGRTESVYDFMERQSAWLNGPYRVALERSK